VGASIRVIDLLTGHRLARPLGTQRGPLPFGHRKALGFKTRGAGAAIVPVMLGDAKLSQVMADRLLEEGIYVIGFFFPVVPKDTARIRVQLSAAHTDAHVDKALAAFGKVGKELGVI
jgi:glycine C-acetyltransferase